MAKRTAPHVWITSSRIGPIYGRRVCEADWQRVGRVDRLTISIWGLDTVGRPRITGDAWAAVFEIALVGNLVSPVKTQALLRPLHDWARTYRRHILVAMFTLVGLAMLAQGLGTV